MPNELILNPLSILDTAGHTVKALTRRKVSFAPHNGSNTGSFGNATWLPNGLINTGYAANPTGVVDYAGAVGDLMNNRIVAACVDAKARAMATAPAVIEKLEGGQWKRIDHDAAHLLNAPNDFHSYYDVQFATTAYEDTKGQGFWRIEYTKGNVPGEIWPAHPDKFQVLGTSDKYISGYRFEGETGVQELENKDVIHFRRVLNLHNGRIGWTPLLAGHVQIHGDNASAIYQSAITDNAGVMSLLIAIKDGLQNQQSVATGQIQEMVEALKRKLRGPGAGAIVGLNLPVDVHKMGYSPDEMAIDKLIQYFTTSICALEGVDPIIIHMAGGSDQPTYKNSEQAIEDFWRRTIVPTNLQRDAALTTQYLPLWGLDNKTHRVARDYDNVPAMQEDRDAKHQRYREDYKAGAYDLWQYQTFLGLTPTEEMRGVFYQKPKAEAAGEGEAPATTPDVAAKSIEAIAWTDEELDAMTEPYEVKYDPNQPRDSDGKFGHGGAGIHKVGHEVSIHTHGGAVQKGIVTENDHEGISLDVTITTNMSGREYTRTRSRWFEHGDIAEIENHTIGEKTNHRPDSQSLIKELIGSTKLDNVTRKLLTEDRYDVEASYIGNNTTQLKLIPKHTDGLSVHQGADGVRTFYDPHYATVENDIVRLKPEVPHRVSEVLPEQSGMMYRGMSHEEMQHIEKSGKVWSSGEYNVISGQENTTLWTTRIGSAESYASGIAPAHRKATFGHPAYVIQAPMADDSDRNVRLDKQVGGDELHVNRKVPKDEITAIVELRPVAQSEMTLFLEKRDDGHYTGTGTGRGEAWLVPMPIKGGRKSEGKALIELTDWING